jgi:hypothetical protein
MMRKLSLLLVLSLVISVLAVSAFAAKAPVTQKANPYLLGNMAQEYSFADKVPSTASGAVSVSPWVPGYSKDASAAPGVVVGLTWYEYQHNGRVPRMSGWGTDGTNGFIAHFSWMDMPGVELSARSYAYNNYGTTTGFMGGGAVKIQAAEDFAGYVAARVMPDNRMTVWGHEAPAALKNQITGYDQADPILGFFSCRSRIPDAVAAANGAHFTPASAGGSEEAIWPSIAYQEWGGQTYMHIAGTEAPPATESHAIFYFRRVGDCGSETWPTPSAVFVIDTTETLSIDIDASQTSGKVAIAWSAGTAVYGECDTCSPLEPWPGLGGLNQMDNDMYVQISTDAGATWQNRINITKYPGESQDAFRAYADANVLIDSDDVVHVTWPARYWPANAVEDGQAGLYRNRIFTWNDVVQSVRTVHDANWDQEHCTPGAWNMQACKPQMSECNGRLYVIFVQYNDAPAGRLDDCAYWGADTEIGGPGLDPGAANADLYVTISADGGVTWDESRNVTNTFTPLCGVGAEVVAGYCDSENWPSMATFGTNVTGTFPAGVENTDWVGVPLDNAGWWLDVQYIRDTEAGGSVQEEGFWSEAEVKWMRIPCVSEVEAPQISLSMLSIAFPAYAQHGQQKDTSLVIENSGNANLTYSVTPNEITGSGWLGVTGFSGAVSSGLANTETGTIQLNLGGGVNNPGTAVSLVGELQFSTNAPAPFDDFVFPINFLVVDTILAPKFDTLAVIDLPGTYPSYPATNFYGLHVGTNGSSGGQGVGEVNLDFFHVDCDQVPEKLGETEVYLYDASPVVGWVNGTDTNMYWSIFGNSWLNEWSFRVVDTNKVEAQNCNDDYTVFHTGTFVTADSTIGLQKTYYGPDASVGNFIVHRLKVFSYDGNAHTGVIIGEAIDWDVPSDTAAYNDDGFDPTRNLIYCQGVDWANDTATAEPGLQCQNNANRYGGMAFLRWFANGALQGTAPYGAYTALNADFVYGNDFGFKPDELYTNMTTGSGFAVADEVEDLHMVMTFHPGYDLGANDTLVFWYVTTSVENGNLAALQAEVDAAASWYAGMADPDACIGDGGDPGCCTQRGDVDSNGSVGIPDVTYLVSYLFGGGPAAPCPEHADVDGNGSIGIPDVTYLVSYLFGGGPLPAPCP